MTPDGRGPGFPEGAGPVARPDPRFPPQLVAFVRRFRAGEYWEAHEVLEDAWRETDSAFYKGLILFASVYVHVRRENAHGIRAQARKTLGALDGLGEAYLGIDLSAVRACCRELIGVVDAGESPAPDERRKEGSSRVPGIRKLPPPPRLALDPARVRGDEPERT